MSLAELGECTKQVITRENKKTTAISHPVP